MTRITDRAGVIDRDAPRTRSLHRKATVSCLWALLIVAGCALPREQTYPSLTPYTVVATAADVGLHAVRAPWWARVVAVFGTGSVIRYSACCQRPEGAHFGLAIGAIFGEVAGIAIWKRP
jgi:hypothetical protein